MIHPEPHPERRVFDRYDAALPIEFEILDGDRPGNRMRGITINVGCGGLLADVGVAAPPGAKCRVVFQRPDGLIEPVEATGYVVHVGMWTHRRTAVGIEFDTPLDRLELPGVG